MSPRRSCVLSLLVALTATPGSLAQVPSSSDIAAKTSGKAESSQQKLSSPHDRSQAEKIYLAGAKALEHRDFAAAEDDFEQATLLDPGDERYRAAYEIARQHQVTSLIQTADKERLLGHDDAARSSLLLAFRLDPTNPMVTQHVDQIAQDAIVAPEPLHPSDDMTAGPIELAPEKGKHSFHLHTNSSELLHQVLLAYGINATTDSSVKSQMVRLDADDVDFGEATRMVKLLTNTFFVPLDPSRILVAEDTKENRTKYERLAAETVYFPGLTSTELTDMGNLARNLFDAQQLTVSPSNSTITLRAPANKLSVLNSTLSEMLTGRGEIKLDVRLYNLAKTRAVNVGIQLPQQTTVFNVPSELNSIIASNQALVQQIISSGLANAGDFAAIAALLIASGSVSSSVLGQPFAVFGGGLTLSGLATSGVTGNLALNSSDSRALDYLTMHVLDQEESTIRSGMRYPIITSNYTNLAGSSLGVAGISSAGISSALAGLGINASSLASATGQIPPQVQYQDLGLTLKVKPYIQKDKDVTLNLDLKILSLQGTSLNNIPVLDSQQYTAIITLHEGASAMVVSALSKQQTGAVSGIPGLSDLPGFQSTTNNQTEHDVSSLVIVITPHVERVAHKQEAGQMFVLPRHP